MSVSKSLQKARTLSRKGEIAGAIELYRDVLDRFPKNRDARRELRALTTAPPPKSVEAASAIARLREVHSRGASTELLSKALGILKHYPNEAEVHNLTGIALASLGQHREAAARYQSALKLHPGYASAFYNLGLTLLAANQFADAVKVLTEAGKLGLDDADLHGHLGRALAGTGDHPSAVSSYRRALDLGGARVALLNNLGNALQELSQNDEAERCYLDALAADPAFVKTHSHLCELYEKQVRLGDLSGAIDRAKSACGPDHPELIYREAQLASLEGRYQDTRELLSKIDNDDLPTPLGAPFFELSGKTNDRLGRFSEAFVAFQSMKDRMRESRGNATELAEEFSGKLKSLRQVWESVAEIKPDENPQSGDKRNRAFLIGFPRSGTTLLDTLLRGHPDIEVIEEKPLVGAMARMLGRPQTPELLAALSGEETAELRQVYETELSKYLPDAAQAAFSVDKLPLNIVNVALIQRVFPDALFILSLRHPCDCVLSCFMQNFQLNGAMANCLTIEGAARLYDNVFGLWQALRTALGPRVIEARYEDLIRDVEGTCRPVIEAVGADWSDDLLDHRSTAQRRGGVRTPSYSQVSQPIYTRAEGRWRNYRSELEPVLPILEPWIEKLGYDL